jgi:hypothetical protein
MLEQRFQPDTSVYVAVEEGLLKLNSQQEYEEAIPPKKGRKKAKDEDREPELTSTGAGSTSTPEGTDK